MNALSVPQPSTSQDDLVLGAMPMIKEMAARLMRQYPWARNLTSREDLEQEGALGAMQAADRYDAAKGEFNAFARSRIEGRMKDLFTEKNYTRMSANRSLERDINPVNGNRFERDFKDSNACLANACVDPNSMSPQINAVNESNYRAVHKAIRRMETRKQEVVVQHFFTETARSSVSLAADKKFRTRTRPIQKSQANAVYHQAMRDIRRKLERQGLTASAFFTRGAALQAAA